MNDPIDLARQVDVVVRELATLTAILRTQDAASLIADAIAAVESAGRVMDCARVRVLAPLVGDALMVERLGFASPIAAVASLSLASPSARREPDSRWPPPSARTGRSRGLRSRHRIPP